MFYSHEILTNRKYGVATIWLVATLGQASTLKKVGRKAIQNVDVPKACAMIMSPQTPMALRLQGHLLCVPYSPLPKLVPTIGVDFSSYGISRVYAEQCNYILLDSQTVKNAIRTDQTTVSSSRIDLAAQKTRREDLLLPESSTYQPEITLPMVDLDLLGQDPKAFALPFADITFDSIGFSPNVSIGPLPLELPSDSLAEFQDADLLEDSRWNSRPSILSRLEDGFPDDGIVMVDDDGDILDVGPIAQTGITTPQNQPRLRASHGTRDAMEDENGEALGNGARNNASDSNILDGEVLNVASSELISSEPVTQGDTSSAWVESPEEQEQAAHGLGATRAKKPIPVDRTLELRNRDINGSSAHYAAIMLAAEKERLARRIPHQAKKNAYHWILGVGLNGIGASTYGLNYPLQIFTGATLYEMIGQTPPAATGRKRSHDSEEAEGEAARNVRRRLEDEGLVALGDDAMEAAREAGKELTDVSSAMPWNTASFRGSSVTRAGSVLGAPGSASRALGSASRSNARLRLPSTSPLVPGSVERHSAADGDDGFQPIDDDDFDDSARAADNAPAELPSWEIVGGSESQDTEPLEFLAFVQAGIEKKTLDERHVAVSDIDFWELLLPAENTRVVAARAFIHVLSLATRGSLIVEQVEPFGRIRMQVA